jgi:hypothetical protein
MPSRLDRVRLTSTNEAHWLEIAQLHPPGASGKPRRDAPGEFWGSVTLHTPDDHIRAHVGWLLAYQETFGDYLREIATAETWDGEKLHRTEDDDLILRIGLSDTETASVAARVLDWWDPYHPSKGGYQHRRELEARFDVDREELTRFASELADLLAV